MVERGLHWPIFHDDTMQYAYFSFARYPQRAEALIRILIDGPVKRTFTLPEGGTTPIIAPTKPHKYEFWAELYHRYVTPLLSLVSN